MLLDTSSVAADAISACALDSFEAAVTSRFEATSSAAAVLTVSAVAAMLTSMERNDSCAVFRAPAPAPISSRLKTAAGTVRSPVAIASRDRPRPPRPGLPGG